MNASDSRLPPFRKTKWSALLEFTHPLQKHIGDLIVCGNGFLVNEVDQQRQLFGECKVVQVVCVQRAGLC